MPKINNKVLFFTHR